MTTEAIPRSPIDTARVFEFLEEVERTIPVDEWLIDGLRVWPLLRNYHAFGLITRHEYSADSQIVRYSGGWHRWRQISRAMVDGVRVHFQDRERNHAASAPADVVALVASSTRYFKIGGRWYNPYCDSFRPHLAERGLSLGVYELAPDGAYRIPRYSSSAFLQNGVFVRTLAAAVRGTRVPSSERLEGIDEMVRISDRILGPGASYPLETLRFRAAQVQGLRPLFRAHLAKSRPAVGILSGYYSSDAMAFTLACRDLGVRTVEVQHGVQGAWHFAYARWARVPTTGYELLPEVFWTWDESARAVIAQWADGTDGAHSAFCGGNPCLSLPAVSDAGLIGSVATVRILFTAQAFFGLPEPIFAALASSPPDWHWLIRVHPQYWETREPLRQELIRRGLRNWSIDEASDAPMATALAASDVHVTEFSSSVLEADALCVPSVLVHPKARQLFEGQLESGMALYAEEGSGIVEAIARQVTRRQMLRKSDVDPASIFTAGCARLAEIVGEVRGAIVARS